MSVFDVAGHITPDELRTLFLFEALDDEQLQWLSEHGWIAEIPAGETVLR